MGICWERALASWLSAFAVLLPVVYFLIFVFLSPMVSGEGSGIRLDRFLIIAFSSTLVWPDYCLSFYFVNISLKIWKKVYSRVGV